MFPREDQTPAAASELRQRVLESWRTATMPKREELFDVEDLDTAVIAKHYAGKKFDQIDLEKDSGHLLPFVYMKPNAIAYYLGTTLIYHQDDGVYLDEPTIELITLLTANKKRLNKVLSHLTRSQLNCLLDVASRIANNPDQYQVCSRDLPRLRRTVSQLEGKLGVS